MLRIGLLINPYAGIGGPLAMKGSDHLDATVSQTTLSLATERARIVIAGLQDKASAIQWFAAPSSMGGDVIHSFDLTCTTVGALTNQVTTAKDTERLAKQLAEAQLDLLLFVGGDGTARNIVNGLRNDYPQQLVLGIPAGVKMHSGVYTVSPQAALRLILPIIHHEPVSIGQQEVRDIDEDALRQGQLNSRYYGELWVPNDQRYIQQVKNTGRQNEVSIQADIAASIIDNMNDDTLYIIGCGTTPQAIMEELGVPNTLLGVDVLLGRNLIASDVTAAELMTVFNRYPHHEAVLLITAIGGQGHIIGRGNQQISADVLIRVGKQNTRVLVTPSKLAELDKRPLFIDSGSPELDQQWSGLITVYTGYQETAVYPLSCGNETGEWIRP